MRPAYLTVADSDIAASIARGDPAGLAAAYDRYAASLYGYCHSLLIHPADAADTVHDTFVIAWTKIPCLRNPDRLGAWLFAMARHECDSRPQAGALSAPPADTGTMTGYGRDANVGDAELQYLVRAALTGLEPAERELIELNLRYRLNGADLADVLGVPRRQAQALATRAGSRFTKLLAMLLAAWPARGRCPGAAGLLDSWDGRLTPALRKRLASHIRRCSVCGKSRHREVRPAMMLALLPAAVPPDRLRERVIGMVTDDSPDAEDRRQRIARRAEPLTSIGFPVQATRPQTPRLPARYALTAAAAAAAVALLGGGAFLVNYTSHSGQPSASGTPVPTRAGGQARAVKIIPPASSSRAHSSSAPASAATLPPATSAPATKAPTSKAPSKKPTPTPSKKPTPTPSKTPTPTPTTTSPTPTPTTTSPTPTPTTTSPTPTPTGTTPTPTGTPILIGVGTGG
jgi:DNA-directed RNA polymerase specialized sigma24 family protein